MGARRLILLTLASLCAMGYVLLADAGLAAAVTQFGSEGHASGQFVQADGVALDRATGDVYIADNGNGRVDKFDGSGAFLMAWGWGVNDESPAPEPQTCTTRCQSAPLGTGAGQYQEEGPRGIAVDDDPLSASYGDVYVADRLGYRVEKFDSSGKFLLMFGGGVNETKDNTPGATEAEKDVCVAGEKCGRGTEGTADGELAWAGYSTGYLVVGPGGDVYEGDEARVQVFNSSGAWVGNVSLSGLSGTGRVEALAVDASGDVYVKDNEVPGVREFEPNGTEKATQFDAGSNSVEAITLDASNDLFVADSNGGFHILKYDSGGKELASFGSHTAEFTTGMAISDALGEIYVSGGSSSSIIWVLTLPQSGPLVEPGSESSAPGPRGAATLAATVDPEGSETAFRFEYVDQRHFQETGYASASNAQGVSIGSSFEDQFASVGLTGLVPGETYHYRIVATNSNGTATGQDETFTATPAALVEGPWVANVTSTSATFNARINPLGASTDYRLEYGTTTSYGQTLTGSVGEGMTYVSIGYHRQELQPDTIYHYRVVTISEVGTVEGADHTFTTQAISGQVLTLPDGRAWELVSPPNKNGSLIEGYQQDPIQAASDGSGITYGAFEPIGETTPMGKTLLSQILSTRSAGGWGTQDITLPHPLAAEEEIVDEGFEYRLFSPDLSLASIQQTSSAIIPLSPETAEGNRLYLRNDRTGTFAALLTPTNVPQGAKLDGEASEIESKRQQKVEFIAATPDQSHVIMMSPLALTPDAVEIHGRFVPNLYEWSAGKLYLVSILPNGQAASAATSETQPLLGGENGFGSALRAVSSDGRWVAWTLGNPYRVEQRGYKGLFVRDMVGGKTVRISTQAAFLTMNSDGTRVFFLESGDLYEFNTGTGVRTDLTANHGAGESSAGVRETLLGVSEDGSYVYFVAKGVLAGGAVGGEDNVYFARYSGGKWTTRYITTLSSKDERDWYSPAFGQPVAPVDLAGVRSRVSPSGRYLAFMSSRSLTGYDNIDTNSGEPDEEVYLYDAAAGRVVCASCDPTGARPVGLFDTGKNVMMDRNGSGPASWEGRWLAGIIPGWDNGSRERSEYQPRYLSDSGRLFFDSPDALVPQDTNGLMDVYEYEPVGVGGCEAAGVGFSEHSGGCVNLISAGTSSSESAFFDASESGDDVFFLTSSRLNTADYDTGVDVYDAHVCSTAMPCVSVPVSSPPCTSGDSCKAAPSPQPEIFGAAPSATFNGAGNVTASPSKVAVARKSLSRAQKLARALRACRNQKRKGQRAACKRRARRQYSARQSRNAKATQKGRG